jgi:hypothetical protein
VKRSTRGQRPPKSSNAGPHHEPERPPEAPPLSPPSWLADLRVQCDDLIAAGLDATDRPSRRVLGRFEARRQIEAAARAIGALLAAAGVADSGGGAA